MLQAVAVCGSQLTPPAKVTSITTHIYYVPIHIYVYLYQYLCPYLHIYCTSTSYLRRFHPRQPAPRPSAEATQRTAAACTREAVGVWISMQYLQYLHHLHYLHNVQYLHCVHCPGVYGKQYRAGVVEWAGQQYAEQTGYQPTHHNPYTSFQQVTSENCC